MYLGEPHKVLLRSKVFKRLGEEKNALSLEDQGKLHVGSSIWASCEGQAAFGQREIHSRQNESQEERKRVLNLEGRGAGVYRTCFDSQRRRGENEIEMPHGAASKRSLGFQMSGQT